MVLNQYVLPFFFQPQMTQYSPDQIRALEQKINTDPAWMRFLQLFPQAQSALSLPNYYRRGISSPVFLVSKDVPYTGEYRMDLWLYARISAAERGISFEGCFMRLDVKKNNLVVSSYELSRAQTNTVSQFKTVEDMVDYFRDNFFNPEP